MGTIKADSIQPTIAGNNLILRTGSDVERVRISPSGDINVSGSIAVSITGNAGFVGNVGVTGNITTSGTFSARGGVVDGLSVTGGASITGNIRVNASTLSIVGVAPSYTARAWASFDEAGTILNSGNVSSVSNPSFSNYTVNFSTAMPTAGYGVAISHTSSPGTSNRVQFVILNGEPLTTSVSIKGGQIESNTLASTFEADRTTVSIIGH